MKKLSCFLVLLVAATSVCFSGEIDTDGYYVMDTLELSAFDGLTSDTATLHFDGVSAGITGAPASYWLQFNGGGGTLPAGMPGAVGWKLTFTNTSTQPLGLTLGVGNPTNWWQTGTGVTVNPGETQTVYLDIQGVDEVVNYHMIFVTQGSSDVSFTVKGAVDKTRPWNPGPEDDPITWVDPEQILSWNTAMVKDPNERPNPDILKHYVFGTFNNASPTDPNMYFIGEVDAGDPVAETAVYPETGTLSLDLDRLYYWQIVEGLEEPNNPGVVYSPTDPNNIIGPVWKFLTRPPYTVPVLNCSNVITTLELANPGPVNISANVTGNTDPITDAAVTLITDDMNFPAGAVYTFTDTTTDNENPTATLVTDTAGTYHVKVSVTDGISTVEKTAKVDVFSDACEAQKDPRSSTWKQNHYDRDGDCDVDIADFSIFAGEWLDDSSLQTQESYAGSVSYIPQSVFDARIEAESVDSNAVSAPPVTDDTGIRIVNEAGATGGGQAIGWTNADDFAEYEITVEAAVYDVWTSTSVAGAGSPAVLNFGDDTTADLYGSVGPFTGTYFGDYHIEKFVGALDFTTVGAGTYTVRITWTDAANLDWFTLLQQ